MSRNQPPPMSRRNRPRCHAEKESYSTLNVDKYSLIIVVEETKFPIFIIQLRVIHMPHTLQIVEPDWIKEQMDELNIQSRDICVDLNIDRSHVSKWINGHQNISKVARAALYYYFDSRRLREQIQNGM